MSDKPLVSVLMTAYNCEKYIAQAIESVLESSYQNFELIIVDDSSTDKTFTIGSVFLKKDARIKLFKNEYNLGQFANRNKAIELAQGVYVKFLDSDDILMPNGLEVMINSMMAFPLAGIGVPAKVCFSDKLPYQLTPHDSVLMHYTGENHLCYGPTATIYKREYLLQTGIFEEQYGILADMLLNIKIASNYSTVLFEKNLFFWRRHSEQITEEQQDDVKMIRERDIILKALMAYEHLPLSKKESKKILFNFLKINTKHFLYYISRARFKDAFQIRRDTGLSIKNVLSTFF